MQRFMIFVALAVVAAGCATAPVLRRQSFDFKTTALFKLPCDTPEVLEAKREIPDDGLETADNQCNSVHMLRMVDRFLSIQEADEAKGVPGDTIAEVRAKGFTIFTDPEGRKRRGNSQQLNGVEALDAVDIGVAAPKIKKGANRNNHMSVMGAANDEQAYNKTGK